MHRLYISLRIINKNGKTIHKVGSRKTKRIFHFIKAAKYQNCVFEVCVTYQGSGQNAGVYKTKKDLIHALRAFTEKD